MRTRFLPVSDPSVHMLPVRHHSAVPDSAVQGSTVPGSVPGSVPGLVPGLGLGLSQHYQPSPPVPTLHRQHHCAGGGHPQHDTAYSGPLVFTPSKPSRQTARTHPAPLSARAVSTSATTVATATVSRRIYLLYWT